MMKQERSELVKAKSNLEFGCLSQLPITRWYVLSQDPSNARAL